MAQLDRFHGKNNHELVQYMKDSKTIKSDRVFRAMQAIDREDYTNGGEAYLDAPQRIGYGITISAPHMHAHVLQLLEDKLQDGGRALDIGSGSGFLTACFAIMMGDRGVAIGIEHIPELTQRAMKNIKKAHSHLLDSGRVKLVVGDGRLGWPEGGPYDAIHVGAAIKGTPQALIDQLAPGGRLIVPVTVENTAQTLVQFDKLQDGKIKRRSLIGVRYGPLTDKETQGRSWE